MCGPDAFDTATALAAQDIALRDLYNTRAAEIRSALQYDCAVFDKNNTCFTFAGRAIDIGGNDAHKIDGSFIGGYRLTPNLHVGGYITPGLPGNAGGLINVHNDVPGLGLFTTWAQNPEGNGFAVHFAGTYETGTAEFGRTRVSTFVPFFFSEPGRGDATVRSSGASAVFSYGMPVENWLATPYLGLQVSHITRDSYTETSGAANPLTFQSLTDRQTTAILGMEGRHRISPRTTLHLGGRFEHDFSRAMSANLATGVGLIGGQPGPVNFGATYRKTRVGVSGGASFDVAPLRTVNVTVGYQQEALGAQTSLTGVVAYQAGF